LIDNPPRGAELTTPEQDPDQFLAKYSKVKLQCRVDRHRWGRKVSYEQLTPSFARRYVMCTECGTQRWIEVNIKTFEWTGRAGYNYASGYLASRLGLTRDDFRERQFREDYADAVEKGRIEYREVADDPEESETVTPITKAKKAS
jgi:hypothetical protein